ncbi:MAG TPA: alpha/beta hydrolase family protein [Terriglobia bacterium]|nr:alpha/beta hydrolase family protein [Terriglobia bacterium]
MLRALILMLAFGTELLAQHVEYKTFQSKLLGRELRYAVYVPPSYNASPARKYPVLYFLHGLFEDETRWSSRGQTDQIMDRMIAGGKIGEFIVAVPFGGTSFYTNLRDGSEKWEDVIVTEFVPMIETAYRVSASRVTRGISGTSMGGYGALKIAMKHPDLFGSASAHSAVLVDDLSAAKVSAGRLQRLQSLVDRVYGISKDLTYWDANNPMMLARDTKKLNGLKLYFDCGTEDEYGFDLGARQLDEMLTKAGYPHEAHLYPGHHGWDYAMQHTSESLLFHWKAFSGK